MPDYKVTNDLAGTKQAVTTTHKSQITLSASNSTALRRIKIDDVFMGIEGTPSDQAMVWDISRITAAGTGTSGTPNPNDMADPAALTVCLVNLTVEPTVTAASNLLSPAVNQRATVRFVPTAGKELVVPATNLAGLAFRVKSAGYTGVANVTANFIE